MHFLFLALRFLNLGFAGFNHDLAAAEEEGLDKDEKSGGDEHPLDVDHIGQWSEEEHGCWHGGAVNHGHNAEDAAEVIRLHLFLDQDGGWRVKQRDGKTCDAHDQ